MAVPLDTHEVVKTLTGAGFTAEQAEAVTRVVQEAQAESLSDLATKTDLEKVRADLERSIAAVRADLELGLAKADGALKVGLAEVRADIERLKGDLVRYVLATGVASVLAIAGLMAAIVRFVPR